MGGEGRGGRGEGRTDGGGGGEGREGGWEGGGGGEDDAIITEAHKGKNWKKYEQH